MESDSGEIAGDFTSPIGVVGSAHLAYLMITVGFLFFKVVDYLLEVMLVQEQLSSILSTLKHKENAVWKFKNYALSFVHSCIASVWILICFYNDRRLFEDMINPSSPLSLSLVSFSVGYFLHDLYHILANDHSRSSLELVPHHVIVILCFGFPVIWNVYVAFAVVALIVEANSIFLHARQLLILIRYPRDKKLYRINSLINIGTFILFRLSTLGWMTRWLVSNRDLVPLVPYTVGTVGMALIVLINLILFYRLINSDFIKKQKCRA